MASYDRASPILIEVEFKQQTPFGALAYYSPTGTPTITVTGPGGTVQVDGASLVDSGTTGKWYYIVQTTAAWYLGDYDVKVNSTDGTYTDVTVSLNRFKLI